MIQRLEPRIEWLLVVPLLVELYLFTVGLGLLLSALYVRFRDIGQVWELAAQLLFFACAIFYPVGILPDWAQKVAFLNPFVQIMQDIRHVMLGGASGPNDLTAATVFAGAGGRLIPSSSSRSSSSQPFGSSDERAATSPRGSMAAAIEVAGVSKTFRIPHERRSRATASLATLDASGTDFFLALGDLDYGETPTDAAWCDWVKAGLPTLGPTYPFELVAGNHEDQNGADGYILNHAACLPDRLGSTLGVEQQYAAEYFFDYPAGAPLMRVFMISPDLTIENVTYQYSLNDVHYRWLSDSIDAARAEGIRWVVVGMHYPCISASNSGCPIGQPLFNLLLQKKVDLVLGGHHHNYQRSKQLALAPGTCPSFVLGGFDQDCVVDSGAGVMEKGAGTVVQVVGTFGRSGSSIKPDDPELPYFVSTAGTGNGIMTYTVTPDRLDANFVPSVGSVTDSFTISAGGEPNGDVTPPTAPSNLVATPVGGDQVDLSWTQSTDDIGIDHYTVIRDSVAVGTTSGTSYLDTSLTPGSTYSYVVRASDRPGTSRRHPTRRPRPRRPGASSRSPRRPTPRSARAPPRRTTARARRSRSTPHRANTG